MRNLRLTLGLVASIGTFAVAASPALAHEFVASTSGATHGTSETEQAFKVGAFKIKCGKVTSKGTVAAGTSSTYTTTLKFAKCLTSAKLSSRQIYLATQFLTPMEVEYLAEGGANILNEVAIKVATGKTEEYQKSECHIYIESQAIPPEAKGKPTVTYTNATQAHQTSRNFPEGLQHYIVISNEFNGIKYRLEGEPCEEWGKEGGPEGGGGYYIGSLPQFLSGGNLEYR